MHSINWLLLNLFAGSFLLNCFFAFYVIPARVRQIDSLKGEIRALNGVIDEILNDDDKEQPETGN